MKKILSLVLAAVMMFSLAAASMTAQADDNVWMKSDFSSDGGADKDFYVGNYKVVDDLLVGYNDAMALQSKVGWYSYDTYCTVAIAEDDNVPEGTPRYFSLVYNNAGEQVHGLRANSRFMSFVYDVNSGKFYLCGDSIAFNAGCIFVGPVDFEMSDEEFHTFGMSVTDQRIRCFVDGECIIDYYDAQDKYFIGDTHELEDDPIALWWNNGNLLMYKEIVVTAPGYTYPITDDVIDFELQAQPVKDGDTEITVDVIANLPEGVAAPGSFGLEVSYDSAVMAPAGEADWKIGGNSMSSTGKAHPYKLMWVSIDPADCIAAGETLIAQITFNLNDVAKEGDIYKFDLAINEDSGVWTMPANGGAFFARPVDADAKGIEITAEKGFTYGDANSDESVNLSDVTVVLQQIAKWENVNINLDAADVNVDGSVNLSDVTLLLQYIAKWDVTLGPKA